MDKNGENTMNIYLVTNEKIAETSSKGNQEKWFDSELNKWYKLDQFGYEALAETLISLLLEKSNVEHETEFRFVRYNMERLNVHNRVRIGCSSLNFLDEGQSIITLAHLFNKHLGGKFKQTLMALPSDKQRIMYIADQTSELTGLQLFPQYLTLLFEMDALFLNDDRHLNNIAVLEKDGKYDYCPIFDNGAGLLSNTQIARMDINPKSLITELRSRPFNISFTRQMNTVRKLYGHQFKVPAFTQNHIIKLIQPLLQYYPERDRDIISNRMVACILTRQKFM